MREEREEGKGREPGKNGTKNGQYSDDRNAMGEEARRTLVHHALELLIADNLLPHPLLIQINELRPLLLVRLLVLSLQDRRLQVPLPLVVTQNLLPQPNWQPRRRARAHRQPHILPHQPHPALRSLLMHLSNRVHVLPETLEEPAVQAPEGGELSRDDVADLVRVLTDFHAEVAAVGEAGDLLEELDLGEGLGEEEERGAEGGGEVDLVGEADAGVVGEDADLWGAQRSGSGGGKSVDATENGRGRGDEPASVSGRRCRASPSRACRDRACRPR